MKSPLEDRHRQKLAGLTRDGQILQLRAWRSAWDISEYAHLGVAPETPSPRESVEQTSPASYASAGWTEEQAIAKTPCIHRGKALGEWVCTPCQGLRVHTIFSCALYGVCTVRAASGATHEGKRTRCCLTCDSATVSMKLGDEELTS